MRCSAPPRSAIWARAIPPPTSAGAMPIRWRCSPRSRSGSRKTGGGSATSTSSWPPRNRSSRRTSTRWSRTSRRHSRRRVSRWASRSSRRSSRSAAKVSARSAVPKASPCGRSFYSAGDESCAGSLPRVLRIYDTAARAKRDFEPRVPGRVSMYVCGPTPYDVPHLGHGRTAIVFDTIRRYLRWREYAVTYVSNVTDVEDRIIARAAQRGTTEPELAKHYEDVYWREVERLDVDRPDETPHATQFVDEMQRLIAELIANGKAYVVEGHGVYFEVDKQPDYGKLSHR